MASIIELLTGGGLVPKSLRDILKGILPGAANLNTIADRIIANLRENELRGALEISGNRLAETLHKVGNQGLQSSSGLTAEQSIQVMTEMADSVAAQLVQAAETLRKHVEDQAAVIRAQSTSNTTALEPARKKRNDSQEAVRQDFIDAGRVALGDDPRTS